MLPPEILFGSIVTASVIAVIVATKNASRVRQQNAIRVAKNIYTILNGINKSPFSARRNAAYTHLEVEFSKLVNSTANSNLENVMKELSKSKQGNVKLKNSHNQIIRRMRHVVRSKINNKIKLSKSVKNHYNKRINNISENAKLINKTKPTQNQLTQAKNIQKRLDTVLSELHINKNIMKEHKSEIVESVKLFDNALKMAIHIGDKYKNLSSISEAITAFEAEASHFGNNGVDKLVKQLTSRRNYLAQILQKVNNGMITSKQITAHLINYFSPLMLAAVMVGVVIQQKQHKMIFQTGNSGLLDHIRSNNLFKPTSMNWTMLKNTVLMRKMPNTKYLTMAIYHSLMKKRNFSQFGLDKVYQVEKTVPGVIASYQKTVNEGGTSLMSIGYGITVSVFLFAYLLRAVPQKIQVKKNGKFATSENTHSWAWDWLLSKKVYFMHFMCVLLMTQASDHIDTRLEILGMAHSGLMVLGAKTQLLNKTGQMLQVLGGGKKKKTSPKSSGRGNSKKKTSRKSSKIN